MQINDIIYFERDKQRYIVDGFQTYDNGNTGVSTRRFIKSRNDWAKVSKAWFTIEDMARNEEHEGWRFINEGQS